MGYPDDVKVRSASRSNTVLRTIALAILALSLILRPLAASLGELHEFAHNPTGQHLDIGDHALKTSLADADPAAQEGDNIDPLHLLLHFAHCCGHTAAAATDYAFNTPALAPAIPPAWQLDTPRASARWTTLFRPPISA